MTLSEINLTKNPEKLRQQWSKSQHGSLQLISLIADQFHKTGLIRGALQCYLAISVKHPRFIPGLLKIASIYKGLGQAKNARTALQAVLKIDHNNLFASKALVSTSKYCKPKNRPTQKRQSLIKNKHQDSEDHDLVYVDQIIAAFDKNGFAKNIRPLNQKLIGH